MAASMSERLRARASLGVVAWLAGTLAGCSGLEIGRGRLREWLPLRENVRWVYDKQVTMTRRENGSGGGPQSFHSVVVEGVERLPHVPGALALATYSEVQRGRRFFTDVPARAVVLRGAEVVEIGTATIQTLVLPEDRFRPHAVERVLIRQDARPGDRWAVRFKDSVQEYVEDSAVEVVGREDVETPAGRFDGCLVVRVTGEGRGWYDRGSLNLVSSRFERTEWYADGVGKVKEVRRDRASGTLGDASVEWEETAEVVLIDRFVQAPMRWMVELAPVASDPDETARDELAGLFARGEFARLEQKLVEREAEVRSGARSSASLWDLYSVFRDAESGPLDAFVSARARSVPSLVARGTHWAARGWRERGSRTVSQTRPEQMLAMRDAFAKAKADHEAALARDPKLLVSRRDLLGVAMALGDEREARGAFEALREVEPDPFDAYARYLTVLEPRWGGSVPAMLALVAEASAGPGGYELSRRVGGEVQVRLAGAAEQQGELGRALVHWDAAVAASDEYRLERANLHRHEGRYRPALADLDAGLRRRERLAMHLVVRSRVFELLGYLDLALADLRDALRFAPLDEDLLDDATRIAALLGDRSGALAIWDAALALAPDDADLWRRKGAFLALGLGLPNDAVPVLERSLALDPADPWAHYQLAHALWSAGDARAPEALQRFIEMADGRRELAMQVIMARQLVSRPPPAARDSSSP